MDGIVGRGCGGCISRLRCRCEGRRRCGGGDGGDVSSRCRLGSRCGRRGRSRGKLSGIVGVGDTQSAQGLREAQVPVHGGDRGARGRCSGEVDKLRLDSLREDRRESWTRDDRPLAAAWTVEHHRWCLVWLRAGWLVSDRNHKRNFKRVTVLAQVRGPAQITRNAERGGRLRPLPTWT